MRRHIDAFLLALEFLTVVRWRREAKYDGPALGASLGYFPLVGLLIGVVLAAVDWTASRLLAAPVVAALLVATFALITGALHLDGLADSADGLFGGQTPAERLAIMRDSRTGSFGVVAVVVVLLLLYAAFLSLGGPARIWALVAVPVFARFAMVLAVALYPYARPSGLGKLYHEHARWKPLMTATVGALACALALLIAGPLLLGVAATVALAIGALTTRRLGGLTGDIYGAIGVLTEALLFVIAASPAVEPWIRPWLRP